MFGADLVVSLTNTSIGLAGATLIAQDWHGRLADHPARRGADPRLPRLPVRAHEAPVARVPLRRRALAQPRARRRDARSSTCSSARARRSACARAEIILFGAGGDVPLRTVARRRAASTQTMQPVAARARDRAARLPARRARAIVVTRVARRPRWPSTCDEHGIARGGDRAGAGRDAAGRRDAARRPARRDDRRSAPPTCGCSRRSPATPACRSSSTAWSRRSGACASCRARSSARRTATR